jgi:peptidoglycan hydrolase-like protein with peptidoglycan-binding domain
VRLLFTPLRNDVTTSVLFHNPDAPDLRASRSFFSTITGKDIVFRLSRARLTVAVLTVAFFGLAGAPLPTAAQSDLARGDVREIQETLNELGYQAGPEDGLYGDKTAEAIRAFERANDLAVTGEADRALLERLRSKTRPSDDGSRDDGRAEAAVDLGQERKPASETADGPARPQASDGSGSNGREPRRPGTEDPTEADDRVGGAPAANLAAPTDDQTTADTDVSALIGTRWRVRDETGATFTMTFRPDGRLQGPTVGGEWAWRRENDRLVIEFDAGPGMSTERRAPWPGNSAAMSGAAESSAGHEWTWSAEKIDGASRSS